MSKYITAAEIDKLSSETGKKLAKQPKVNVMIAQGEEPTFRCIINGYKFEFPRGEMVKVPKDVATFIQSRVKAAVESEKRVAELLGDQEQEQKQE